MYPASGALVNMSDFLFPGFFLVNKLVLYIFMHYNIYSSLLLCHFKVCKYYLQGACHYGSRCRYDHVKPGSVKILF